MPIGWMAGALLLDLASLALAACWAVGLYQLIRTVRRVPTARAGLSIPLPDSPPRVCLIIPAHNEAAHIGDLVVSLRAQDYPALRVVFVLDRCTDGTAAAARGAIAGDPRFEIVEISSCPEGWAGKVNAVWRGVRGSASAADADMLAFADADCVFHAGCIRATVALMTSRGLDLLSLLSTLTHDRWFELLVQPAATLETVVQYPLIRAAKATGRRAFANGQFMMFTREAYEDVGGHEAVRQALLEDLALSRLIAARDRPAAVVVADGMVTCSMYTAWSEFRSGWKRIYTELASRKPERLVRHAWRVRAMGSLLPLAALGNIIACAWDPGELGLLWCVPGMLLGAAGLAALYAVAAPLYRIGHTPLWAVPGYPIGAWCVSVLLSGAARDLKAGRAIEWAGREYVLNTR
jgi:hypothetical protein